ncbi:acyclic terpene utilization AtuA family protein [Paraburkholderia sediminicola]|uniref:acyclic terpene utilization AtuA family protein n=1 Tax=Paraburkholderia sediminicola TaxID=458836 RepID=UPI0038BCFE0E
MEIRVLAGNGCLGTGFKPESLERGVAMKPHVIACDAGSTDSGPSALGAGRPKLSREACKRDLRLLLLARHRLQVPLIVGSCGTSGRDVGVDWVAEMAREIATEENISFRLAVIKSDQQPEYLKRQLANGRIRPLEPAPPIDASTFDSPVVGMMGTEPIVAAIEEGAQVILAGRASDSALYAAVPVALGADPGLAWHAAKTLECGAACAVVPAADSMFATIRDDHFDIEPLDREARCTPLGIAAHTLYENANPFLLTEPGGVIDTEGATYEALDERRVRVRGSRFHPSAEYTIKLEGAAIAGYQTVIVGGVRDQHVIKALPGLVQRAQGYFRERVADLFGDTLKPDDYDIEYRLYGIDGVMGELEPLRNTAAPHEIGVLITVTAPTQEQANKIASFVAHVSSHLPVPGYEGIISTIAYPYSPPEIPRGAVYRFTLNHINVPDTPLDMFRTTFIEV